MYALYSNITRCLPERKVQRIEFHVAPASTVEDLILPKFTTRGEENLQQRVLHGLYPNPDVAVVNAIMLVNGRQQPGTGRSSGYTMEDSYWYCCLHL